MTIKQINFFKTIVSLCFTVFVCVIISACSRSDKPESSAKADLSWLPLITSDVDLVIIADIAALKKSEWYDSSQTQTEQQRAVYEQTGFSHDNVTMVILATDLDAMPPLGTLTSLVEPGSDISPISMDQVNVLSDLNTAIHIFLDKSISFEQLTQAVRLIFSADPNASISFSQDQSHIIVKQDSSPVPLFISLSGNSRILHLKTKGPSSSAPEPGHAKSEDFIREYTTMQTFGPVTAIMFASTAMQAKIKTGIEDTVGTTKDLSAAMLSNLLKPFSSFRGMSAALAPSSGSARLHLVLDLDNPDNASSAESTLQSLIPLMSLALTQQAQEMPPDTIKSTKTSVSGSKVIVEMEIQSPLPENLNQIPQ